MTDNNIKIPKDKRQEMVAHIQDFFQKERDEEIGDLAAGIILDFFIDKLGPEIYNQGVNDSYNYLNDRIIDVLGLQK